MPLNLFYTMVQKSQKWPKTQIKGGSCLKWRPELIDSAAERKRRSRSRSLRQKLAYPDPYFFATVQYFIQIPL